MTKPLKGRVQWFDETSGEGVVVGDNGKSYYVHYSSIVPKSERRTTGKTQRRRILTSGKEVEFEVYTNIYSERVSKVQELG